MQNFLFKALCATLDQLSAGIIVMFSDGRLLHANRAAREMMADGWPVRASNGYIQGKDKPTTEAILHALRSVVEEAESADAEEVSRDICLARVSYHKRAVIGSLKPFLLAEPGGHEQTVVALFVTHLEERPQCSLAGIGESFNLTPAETRTLERLVQGGTVSEVAAAIGISENTVKTHLQNIFSKTETSGQKDLLRLVNELRAPLRLSRNAKLSQSHCCGMHSPAIGVHLQEIPQPAV